MKQLKEQILDDGGNFELSPMYHSIFTEDILDLINIFNCFPDQITDEQKNILTTSMKKMIHWLDIMTHPDGEISFFNDAAIGIAPEPSEIKFYAQQLGINYEQKFSQLTHLQSSGYVRISEKDATLFLDGANVGPDYLPGHAHADTLSFELSVFGERLFVNSGTSEYGNGDVRQYERSTAAHNTVVVNSQNSSEVWDGFRVARRAYLKIC